MPSATVLKIDNAQVKFGDVADPIVPGALTDYGCQVTQAQITATSNTTTTTVPATFCQAASESTVPVASTFALVLDWLQDWTLAQGLSAFMFKHDASKKAFALYLNDATDPSATGVVTVVAGAYAGTPGEPLTAGPVTMNIDGYPDIVDATGAPIRGELATGATAGSPGTWTPPGSSVPSNLTQLQASSIVASPATAWTTGQHVILGDLTHAHWDGDSWNSGDAP
jgi:hypothetical protein